MFFFGFLSPRKENVKKTLKRSLLGRIFFFIQIAYIIHVKEVLCKMPLILLKTEKNVFYGILHGKSIL